MSRDMRPVLVALIVLILIILLIGSIEAAVPPRPEQPRPDIFTAAGIENMQTLNPLTVHAKANRTASYRLITMSGCVSGSITSDMALAEEQIRGIGMRLTRNDSAYQFTIRVNCGSEHIRICGSVNIFCLGRGFPYIPDVDLSDIMYTQSWPQLTRVSIILHEVFGHAVGTWNEQYCSGNETTGLCKGLGQFGSAPGWLDFMNTGANSRHYFEAIERERIDRTLWFPQSIEDPPCNPCWTGTRWRFSDGWEFQPAGTGGIWYRPDGRAEWGACDLVLRGCWNLRKEIWIYEGGIPDFDPSVTPGHLNPPVH